MAIANADGSIVLTTKVDQSGLKKGMSTMKGGVSSLTGAFGKLAGAIGIAFSVGAIVKFSKEASNLATETEASVQRLIDIYGEASKAVGDFIDFNAQALGISRTAAASFSSVYGNLFSVWADQETNAELTNRYLNMTAVVASKTGRTVEDVQERIRSGLLGNTEAIEDLGVFVNVKTIEMTDAFKRMASGKSWEQLDAYTQQQIRTFAILEQATAKYGNEVAKTSALTKSQFRAAWQDFQATWGQVVNRILMPILETLTDILVSATAVMQSLFNISSLTISQGDAIEGAIEKQNDFTKSVEETNEAMEKTTASFDTVEILSSTTDEKTSAEPIIPETGGGFGEIVNTTETEKEASVFEKILERISEAIIKVWNSEPVQSFWEAVKSAGKTGLQAFKTIGTSLLKNLKTTWGNVEGDFNTMTSNMSGLWTTFWQDVQLGIDTWGQPIIEGVNGVFNSMWTTAIDPYIQLMVGAWSDFTSILKSKWDEYGQPLLNNIGQFAKNAIGFFRSIYDNVLKPIITPFLQTMSSLWDNHLSAMIGKVADFVMKVANGALEIYNQFIHPIVMWIVETLEPIFTWIGNVVFNVFGTIISTVSDVLGGVFDALGGLIDFIVGVFTGDWEKAWNGIKSFFSGIWDAIWGIIKGVINFIIDGLNFLWGGLYGALAAIINGVGGIIEGVGDLVGADWGWEIPSNPPLIPRLAQGTVVPPNKEFMAVLGDNTQEHEVVSPISTMKQAFMEAMIEMGGNFGGGGNTEVVLEIDGREFGRAVVEQGNRENRRIGTRLVIA